MNVRFKSRLPWALAFSFARAIQQPAMEIWQGQKAQMLAAQQALNHRARCNRAARRGEYNAAIDKDMSMTTSIPRWIRIWTRTADWPCSGSNFGEFGFWPGCVLAPTLRLSS
jgi:hypothetical protein